jgi:regulator of cell morphogenesis and NO signaling
MENLDELTLAEIVRQNYHAAAALEKFSLDFCCKGNRNFLEACREKNIDPAQVKDEILRSRASTDRAPDFATWTFDFLIDYICERHHKYIEEKAPEIRSYLDKICQVHGAEHPELHEIKKIFFKTSSGLAVHMKKEELMLFPFIRKIARSVESNIPLTSPLFKSVHDPIEMMQADHSEEGEELRKIAQLSNDYQVPADGCTTYGITYKLLDEFEKDLHTHIHLENNILFPKAIKMEQALNSVN